MSNFSASIQAILDTSKIPNQIKDIEKKQIVLNKFKLDTSGLPSQIQASLDKHKFTIKLDGIKASNMEVSSKGIKRSVSEIQSAYSDLIKLQRRINSTRIQISGLDETKNKAQIVELSHQLNRLMADYNNLYSTFSHGFSTDQIDNLNRSFEIASDKISVINSKFKDAASNFNKASLPVSSLKMQTLDNKMSGWLDKNSRAAKDFGGAIEDLRNKLNTLNATGQLTEAEFNDIQREFKEIQQQAIAAGKVGKTFGDTFKGAFENISKYVSVSTVISKIIESLKQMYQNVYDVDTAMTNLYKVTDETAKRYDDFLDSATQKAKKLGATVSDIVEQTANWAKLGYSLDDAEELAELSTIYANVGEVAIDTAVSDMVTAMKAFNLEASEAQTIVDSLNELGNNFATSAADLGEGLTKSASAMNTAGTNMYKTLAMLTGGSEITQNASEFGNFLKVASMRIRGMKGELEELGEEVDESVDSISKVQTQILNLTHGEVNIFDDSGEFRDFYDIMKEISEVVDNLTSTEQASLYEILFGKLRGNQGAALIQAFQSGQIESAYESVLNSKNSAIEEQEKWLESLEAKTQQFQAAWQELSNTTLDSDFLKGLIDGGTTILSILSDIIDNFGVMPTLITATAAAMSLKNIGKDKMFSFKLVENVPIVILFPLDIMVFDITLNEIH